MSEYQINYCSDRCVEVKKDFFGLKVCRIPYPLMKSKKYSVQIEIKHVVYILFGKDGEGKDCIYVGKSSNGTKNRPTDHEDEGVEWTDCYILAVTDSDSFNGGMAEYLEHRIKELVDDSKRYRDITRTTTEVNANESEKRRCNSIIPTILEMLDVVGICLVDDNPNPSTQPTPSPQFGAQAGQNPIDFTSMNMGKTLNGWLKKIEQIVKAIDPSVEVIIKSDSKYVAFKKGKKTAIRCYPKKDDPHIDSLFYGTPDIYSDSRIVPRPENRHDKPLDSMFVVKSDEDLDYFRIFAEKAFKQL